eukprot:11972281-Karenia_brevis.AAC.1
MGGGSRDRSSAWRETSTGESSPSMVISGDGNGCSESRTECGQAGANTTSSNLQSTTPPHNLDSLTTSLPNTNSTLTSTHNSQFPSCNNQKLYGNKPSNHNIQFSS